MFDPKELEDAYASAMKGTGIAPRIMVTPEGTFVRGADDTVTAYGIAENGDLLELSPEDQKEALEKLKRRLATYGQV